MITAQSLSAIAWPKIPRERNDPGRGRLGRFLEREEWHFTELHGVLVGKPKALPHSHVFTECHHAGISRRRYSEISQIVNMMLPRKSPGTCFVEGAMSESETTELVENLRRAKRRWKAIAVGQLLLLVILFFCFVPRSDSRVEAFWRGLGQHQKEAIERQAAMERVRLPTISMSLRPTDTNKRSPRSRTGLLC